MRIHEAQPKEHRTHFGANDTNKQWLDAQAPLCCYFLKVILCILR